MESSAGLSQHLRDTFYNDRVIFMNAEFSEESVNDIEMQLLACERIAQQSVGKVPEGETEPITMDDMEVTIYISSYGGDVYELLRLYDLIHSMPFKVNTVASGKAMSAGALLLSAGTGVRSAYQTATIMLHSVQALAMGSLPDMENEFAEIKRLQTTLFKILKEKTGLNTQKLNELMAKDTFLTPQQAKKLGLIDEVIGFKQKRKHTKKR